MEMNDVMLEEARMWLDEPPQRKRKLEPPPPIPSPRGPVGDYDTSDEEMDPVDQERYRKQVVESCGFDVDDGFFHPFGGIYPVGCSDDDNLYAKIGLHCYNIQKGTNLQFRSVLKVNVEVCSITTDYVTLEAMDPVNNSPHIFQTSVNDPGTLNKASLVLMTLICRIKPQVPGLGDATDFWDFDAIDDFYKGDIPNWLQDDVVTGGDKLQFYEVTELDLEENRWLYLFAEVALFSYRQVDWSKYMPFKMNRIVIQTKEDVVSNMKLKASNAIFYLDFKTCCGIECKGIIRKTMDGLPGHLSLEAKCELQNQKTSK